MAADSFVPLYHRMKISTKIFVISFILISTLIAALNYLYQRNVSRALLFAQTEFSRQLIDKSNDYLMLNFKNMKSFFLSVANDPRLQTGNYEQIQAWLNDNLILYIPNAKNIHLFKDNQIVASTSPLSWMLEDSKPFLAAMAEVKLPYEIYWSKPYPSPVSNYTITTIMKMTSETGATYTLALDLDFGGLYNSIMPSVSSSLKGNLLLLDRQNQPVYGTAPYMSYNVYTQKYDLTGLPSEVFDKTWMTYELTQNQTDLLLIRKQNDWVDWQEVWVLDRKELLQPLQKSISFNWFLTVISILLAFIIACMISILIGGPIKKIARSMDEVSRGQWNTKIAILGHDELGVLANHFNHMTKKIRELIDDLKYQEEEKKKSDFLSLQSQISPHFLYNSLNCIRASARENQFDKVDALISSLTETVQYSLDAPPAPLSFQKELNAVKSYIHLMQIRYDNHFIVEMDIDPQTYPFLLPKFTLQPLVENSIFHGIVPRKEPGSLFIGTAFHTDSWDIIVEDSGLGMEPEKLIELLTRLEMKRTSNHSHIGLYSVHNRLKLMFGEAYELRMASSHEWGTRIILTLPALIAEPEEEIQHAHYIAGR